MRSALIAILAFLIGVLATLIVKLPSPRPPEVVVCPPPLPCEVCPPLAAAGRPAQVRPAVAVARRTPRQPEPLPPPPDEPEVHRERLRAWFESQAGSLTGCFAEGDGRRRLLVELKLDPDGTVTAATLLGATDLSRTIADCIHAGIKAMHAPKEELRGRETLVVHVSL